jgi:hypothetical protein
VNEFDSPISEQPVTDSPSAAEVVAEVIPADLPPVPDAHPPVDPARSAAGRLGAKRVHTLALLGREYEKEHGLKAGRQRQKQLIQLGKRYEVEHGLRAAKPRRSKPGDAWQEFLAALARVVKPAHRPAVEQLVAALRPVPKGATEQAA